MLTLLTFHSCFFFPQQTTLFTFPKGNVPRHFNRKRRNMNFQLFWLTIFLPFKSYKVNQHVMLKRGYHSYIRDIIMMLVKWGNIFCFCVCSHAVVDFLVSNFSTFTTFYCRFWLLCDSFFIKKNFYCTHFASLFFSFIPFLLFLLFPSLKWKCVHRHSNVNAVEPIHFSSNAIIDSSCFTHGYKTDCDIVCVQKKNSQPLTAFKSKWNMNNGY